MLVRDSHDLRSDDLYLVLEETRPRDDVVCLQLQYVLIDLFL